jgi:hypothetical protein
VQHCLKLTVCRIETVCQQVSLLTSALSRHLDPIDAADLPPRQRPAKLRKAVDTVVVGESSYRHSIGRKDLSDFAGCQCTVAVNRVAVEIDSRSGFHFSSPLAVYDTNSQPACTRACAPKGEKADRRTSVA